MPRLSDSQTSESITYAKGIHPLVCGGKAAAQVEHLEIAMSKKNCIKETSARTMAERAKVLVAVNKGEGTRVAALTVRR
jgi:hypothetical protein